MSPLFTKKTLAIFWNNNTKAIQRMLDYDFTCGRETPSVVAIVHPTASTSFGKFFFGNQEIMIPIYTTTVVAAADFPKASVFLNFASFRSAYDVTLEALSISTIKTLMITAEGIPERLFRELTALSHRQKKLIIGPSTVGAIAPGCFKTGNIGGTIDRIIKSKLHKQGSAGLVTRSGGLFNELANIISLHGDGIAEGVAVGGDRFPGSSYLEHLLRMEQNPQVKYHILLGEVGGKLEYEVIDAVKKGHLKKPIISWCIGTVAKHFSDSIQFGHAGANANTQEETADAKNKAMKKAGFRVPKSFNQLPDMIQAVFQRLQAEGMIPTQKSVPVPFLAEDYTDAKKTGKIRKETSFVCTISDDRGDEAVYAGIPISKVATPETGFSISDIVCLLWFKKIYPKWASNFIETVLKTVADHGPAVSGAHNARVSARAGKDLVSALASGILTIGPKFGGAIDDAATYFKDGLDKKLAPKEFIDMMKKKKVPIAGIGHKIKSVRNPDLRVTGLINYARKNFPQTTTLDFALEVEKITTTKKENLILNVDGTIGVLLVDMWKSLNYSDDDISELISTGTLNGFFVLGRTIGFIGHILDEKRQNMPLYRHPFDDILYDLDKVSSV